MTAWSLPAGDSDTTVGKLRVEPVEGLHPPFSGWRPLETEGD